MESNLETNIEMSAVNLDQTQVESAEKMKLGMDVSNRRVFLISFILLSVVVMFAFGLGYLGCPGDGTCNSPKGICEYINGNCICWHPYAGETCELSKLDLLSRI